jgi:hypothetical protein
MIKDKDMQFFMENLKMKRKKGQKFFHLPEQGFEPQIFSNFPNHDLNFHEKRGARDQIKTSF